jgi:glycine cleavage system protein P-like pyridoxal-binding family
VTTLAEARAELHALAERQAKMLLRVRRGELVRLLAMENFAVSTGHRHRDIILNAVTRHTTKIAAAHGLDPRALLHAFDNILHVELTAHAKRAREEEHERQQ